MKTKDTFLPCLALLCCHLLLLSSAQPVHAQDGRDFFRLMESEQTTPRDSEERRVHQDAPLEALQHLFGNSREAGGSPEARRPPSSSQPLPGSTVHLHKERHNGLSLVRAPELTSLPQGAAYGESCQGYLFLIQGTRRGESRQGLIYSPDGTRNLGSVDNPGYTHCIGEYFFVGSRSAAAAVFHIPTERLTHLSYRLPNGAPGSDSYLFPLTPLDPEVPTEALLYTRDRENNRFIGLWQPGLEEIALRDSPFGHIRDARFVGESLQISSGFPSSNHSSRTALHLVDRQGIREIHSDRSGNTITFLADGWTAYRINSGGGVISPSGEKEPLELRGCRHSPSLIGASHKASALLMACFDARDDAFENYLYWSQSTGSITWRQRRGYERGSTSLLNISRRTDTVIFDFNTPTHPTKLPRGLWFDLSQGAFFQGSPLFALSHYGNSGRSSRFLATNVEMVSGSFRHQLDVHLIDIERGTETFLHAYQDCPGYLHLVAQNQTQDEFIIHCLTKPESGRWHFIYHWSELVDVQTGTRWRETNRRHEGFTDRGAVVLSNLSAGTNHSYAVASRLWITADPVSPRPQ